MKKLFKQSIIKLEHINYENKMKTKTRSNIKPGTKIFLVGDLKLEGKTNKIIPDIPKLKNKLQKTQRRSKILAKIISVENIERSDFLIKICKRPINGMILIK